MTIAVAAFAAFIISLDMLVVGPVLPVLIAQFHIPQALWGAASGIYAGAFALTSLAMAPLADRLGRRQLLLLGAALFLAANFGAAVSTTLALFLLARAITGMGAAIMMPNMWTALAMTTNPQRLARSMGLIWTAISLASLLGVPFGAFVSSRWGWSTMLAAFGIAGVGVFLAFVRMPVGPAAPVAGRGYLRRFADVLGHGGARRALATTLLWNLSLFGLFSFVGTFYASRFGTQTRTLALYLLGAGIGNFVGSALGGQLGDRFGKSQVVRWTALAAAASQIAMSLTSVLAFTVTFQILWSFSVGLGAASLSALVISQLPSARGALMSLNSFAMNAGVVIGVGVGGAVLRAQPGGYWLIACVTGAAAALAGRLVPNSAAPAATVAAPQRSAA